MQLCPGEHYQQRHLQPLSLYQESSETGLPWHIPSGPAQRQMPPVQVDFPPRPLMQSAMQPALAPPDATSDQQSGDCTHQALGTVTPLLSLLAANGFAASERSLQSALRSLLSAERRCLTVQMGWTPPTNSTSSRLEARTRPLYGRELQVSGMV